MKYEFYEELITTIVNFMEGLTELLQINDSRLFLQSAIIQQFSHQYIQNLMQFLTQINYLGIKSYQHQLLWNANNTLIFQKSTQAFAQCNIAPDIQALLPTIQEFLKQKLNHTQPMPSHQVLDLEVTPYQNAFAHLFFFVQHKDEHNIHIYLTALRVQTTQPLHRKNFFQLPKKELIHPSPHRPPVSEHIINRGYKFYYNSSKAQYQQHQQLIKAFELITLTHLSFKEVAYHANFNSYTTMYRIFVRYDYPLSSINRFVA